MSNAPARPIWTYAPPLTQDKVHGWADLQGEWTPKRGPYIKPEDSHDAFCRASDVTVTDANGKFLATVNSMTGVRTGVPYNGHQNRPLGMVSRKPKQTKEDAARRMKLARNASAANRRQRARAAVA